MLHFLLGMVALCVTMWLLFWLAVVAGTIALGVLSIPLHLARWLYSLTPGQRKAKAAAIELAAREAEEAAMWCAFNRVWREAHQEAFEREQYADYVRKTMWRAQYNGTDWQTLVPTNARVNSFSAWRTNRMMCANKAYFDL